MMNLKAISLIPGAGAATLLFLAACQQSESPAPSAPSAQETPSEVSPESAPLIPVGPGQKLSGEELAELLEIQKRQPLADAGISTAPLAKTAAALPTCYVNFDVQAGLAALPNQAWNTAAFSPFYSQTCNTSYTVVSAPLVSGAYRLIPENSYWCMGPAPTIGTRTAGGDCAFPSDGKFWRRRVGNMASNTGVSFNVHNGTHWRDFDLKSVYVHSGALRVVAYFPDGTSWYWNNLTAGKTYGWPAGTKVSQLQLFESNKNGSFTADNLGIAIHP